MTVSSIKLVTGKGLTRLTSQISIEISLALYLVSFWLFLIRHSRSSCYVIILNAAETANYNK